MTIKTWHFNLPTRAALLPPQVNVVSQTFMFPYPENKAHDIFSTSKMKF